MFKSCFKKFYLQRKVQFDRHHECEQSVNQMKYNIHQAKHLLYRIHGAEGKCVDVDVYLIFPRCIDVIMDSLLLPWQTKERPHG